MSTRRSGLRLPPKALACAACYLFQNFSRRTPPMQTIAGLDVILRRRWSAPAPDFVPYHDTEWGFPVRDDRRLFEKLCLEGFQSGLSWLTILRKREGFRRAFANFEIVNVSELGARDVTRMLKDTSIIRHRGKIESTINNARRAVEIV